MIFQRPLHKYYTGRYLPILLLKANLHLRKATRDLFTNGLTWNYKPQYLWISFTLIEPFKESKVDNMSKR